MSEILGAATLLAKALPTGVDGDRVAQFMLQDGVTYGQFVTEYVQALAGMNAEMFSQWGWTFGVTTEMMMEYEQGGSVTGAQKITDIDIPDTVTGKTIGHMIDLDVWGVATGGSKRFLRDMRSTQLSSILRPSIRRLRWTFENMLLTRLFTNTEFAVGSGYNVPFVRGTGGNVDYAPLPYAGDDFDTSHTHFLFVDSDTDGLDDAIEQWVATLVEHGHMAPFDLIVSKADVDAGLYKALTGYVQLVSPVIQQIDRGGVTSGSQFFANGQASLTGVIGHYQSVYGLVNLHASPRVPAGYGGGGKSYGTNDPRNPLAIRIHPDSGGFGARVWPETTTDTQYPIKRVIAEMEFGIGVGEDRTNGAVFRRAADGGWVNPIIS